MVETAVRAALPGVPVLLAGARRGLAALYPVRSRHGADTLWSDQRTGVFAGARIELGALYHVRYRHGENI